MSYYLIELNYESKIINLLIEDDIPENIKEALKKTEYNFSVLEYFFNENMELHSKFIVANDIQKAFVVKQMYSICVEDYY
jgi:hypothetical protein